MNWDEKFTISFEGLKNGKHLFEYKITTGFFEELTYSIIRGGDIAVEFHLNKKETMMIGEIEMSGTIQKSCDRCTHLMEIPIDISHQIIYKFGEGESDDENLIILPYSAYKMNIASTLYELLTVALPNRTVHTEENCNEEMLELLDQYVDSSENEDNPSDKIDPRWEALKKLN